MAKKILRKIENIIFFALALIFKLIPRNKHMWVTGKISAWGYDNEPPMFFDNSKYFFLYLVNNTNEKVYWISSSNKEIDLLQEMNLPAIKFPSIKSIWLILRAKYFFHHYGTNQINAMLQLGSIQINFWHAMPFKKMRFSVVPRIDIKIPFFSSINEYALSSSQYLSENACKEMYDLPLNKILNFGYPRQDILCYDREALKKFCCKYSKNLLEYIKIAEKYKSVFLYTPTWRDDDPDYFIKLNIEYELLSKQLSKINGVIFFKLHPLTKNTKINGYNNIINIDNSADIYPFLPFVDYLITDYSSICYDYLLLDKEIIFIPYDLEKYKSIRGLYFDYDSVTPGKKYYTFSDFVRHICDSYQLNYKKERLALREKFFDNYQYDASKQTYEFFSKSAS